MIDWKIIVGLGGFAFIISLLTGLISGVQFGVLLFRAILGGLVFAGLGFGGGYLIEKFLPELTRGESPSSSKDTGGTVDIVVDDEEEETKASGAVLAEGTEDSEREEGFEASQKASGQEAASNTVMFANAQSSKEGRSEEGMNEAGDDGENFVEEVEETAATEDEETVESHHSETEDDGEVVEELTEADDNVEALPEIDSFSDSFSSEDLPDAEGELGGSGGSSETVDVMGEEQDPHTVAKAIQTMIKRDE